MLASSGQSSSSWASNPLSFVTLSLSRRAKEPGHLLHSALTCHRVGRHRISNRDICTRCTAQQLSKSSDESNRRAAVWADRRWNAELLESTTRLHTFITDIGTHPPGMALPRTARVWLNTSTAVLDVSAPAYTNRAWSPLRLVSLAQNRPSTMSFTIQSIHLPMERMARIGNSKRTNTYILEDAVQNSIGILGTTEMFVARLRVLGPAWGGYRNMHSYSSGRGLNLVRVGRRIRNSLCG